MGELLQLSSSARGAALTVACYIGTRAIVGGTQRFVCRTTTTLGGLPDTGTALILRGVPRHKCQWKNTRGDRLMGAIRQLLTNENSRNAAFAPPGKQLVTRGCEDSLSPPHTDRISHPSIGALLGEGSRGATLKHQAHVGIATWMGILSRARFTSQISRPGTAPARHGLRPSSNVLRCPS